MGDVANTMPAAVSVFDPCFADTVERGAKNEVLASTVRTAREVVLTQEASAPSAKAIKIANTESITIWGDVVRVHGTIRTPGRAIKIFCRLLDFISGTDDKSGIDVSGAGGKDGEAKDVRAAAGKDGINRKDADGKDGENGTHGDPGKNGGTIEICCDTIVVSGEVILSADGGRGGNGAPGQHGGHGGDGSTGFTTEGERVGAFGGSGGRGGHGGDGGNAGNAGAITLQLMNIVRSGDKSRLTVRAFGGRGGNGAAPGKGGNGGDGGTPAPQIFESRTGHQYERFYLGGADAGGGGICGVPGYGGGPGVTGVVKLGVPISVKPGSESKFYSRFHWDWLYEAKSPAEKGLLDALLGAATVAFPDKPLSGRDCEPLPNRNECGLPGKPGQGSELGRADKQNFDPAHPERTGIHSGAVGKVRPNVTARKEKAAKAPTTPAKLDLTRHQKIEYKDLAAQADMEQLKMLFESVRTRYLLTGSQTDFENVQVIMETLVWLASVAESKDKPLFDAASATLNNLREGWNVFGRDTDFAALGTLKDYQDDLTTMLDLFDPIERTYTKLNKSLKATSEQDKYLKNVIGRQKTLIGGLQKLENKIVDQIKSVAVEFQTLDDARRHSASVLTDRLNRLRGDIQEAIGLSAADFCNLFTQLSFTSVEPSREDGVIGFLDGFGARGGAMVLSQAGEMVHKALENVPSDTGAPINKNWCIRRMQYLNKSVNTVAGLKEAKDGLIKTDPSAEFRLLATREQLEAICSNFYEQFPVAKEAVDVLDEYIETVAARNEKIAEYNQLLTELCYIRGERQKTEAQQVEAEGTQRKTSSPGLHAMAGYASALRRHALERCIEQLYMASRVLTMQALDSYDVFADVLGQLGSTPGELDSSALKVGLIDIIEKKLAEKQSKGTLTDYESLGSRCKVILTPEKNPLLFRMLSQGKAGTFQILPVGPDTTMERNPFARMAEVRVTGIRCTAIGATTSDGTLAFEITHPGIETFYREDGHSIRLRHTPVTTPCRYDMKSPGPPGYVALDRDHRMIGPFCAWIIRIPEAANDKLNLTGLHSITVEFQGKFRAFQAGAESGALAGAVTG